MVWKFFFELINHRKLLEESLKHSMSPENKKMTRKNTAELPSTSWIQRSIHVFNGFIWFWQHAGKMQNSRSSWFSYWAPKKNFEFKNIFWMYIYKSPVDPMVKTKWLICFNISWLSGFEVLPLWCLLCVLLHYFWLCTAIICWFLLFVPFHQYYQFSSGHSPVTQIFKYTSNRTIKNWTNVSYY